MMAAGLITIAHNSGGPKADIIVPNSDGKRTGFLASTEDEYARAIHRALYGTNAEETYSIRQCAQESSTRFSDDVFNESFKSLMMPLLKP